MGERREFRVEGLAPPISHYCDAVRFGDVLYISGVPPTDAAGKLVRTFTGRAQGEGPAGTPQGGGGFGGGAGNPPVPTEVGLNRFVWNYRLPNATGLPGLIMWGGSLAGPRIVPGAYGVRLTVDGRPIALEGFNVKADPRLKTTQEDFQKQFDFLSKANAKLTETHNAILEIRDLKKQFEELSSRLKPEQKDLKDRAADIAKKLTAVVSTIGARQSTARARASRSSKSAR